jgi:hypothetical protein
VEQGKLVQQINRSRLVRQVAFNAANTTAYEVRRDMCMDE